MTREERGERRRRRALVASAVVFASAVVLAPVGWIVSDRLEQDNDFCNACHLSPTEPLHRAIRAEFDARPARSLAAAHAPVALEGRAPGDFRCIDCHGGVGFAGRVRVKTLAAKDAFWYAVGRFEEPVGMRWPLWDEDCSQCHARFDERADDAGGALPFHALAVHNAGLPVRCVECHEAHGPGGNPDAYFLHAASLRAQCARCHSEFEEGGT